MKPMFDRGVVIGLGLIVAALLVSAWVSFRNIKQLDEDAAWVAHTQEVRDLTSNTLRTLVDAETGVGGFLLTGKDDYLKPYDDAVQRLDGLLGNLRAKTADNRLQRDNVKRLEQMSEDRLAQLKETVALRRKDEKEAQALVAAGKGKAQMDAIRSVIADMDKEERRLLQLREGHTRRAYQVAQVGEVLMAALGLALVGAFAWLLRRSLLVQRDAAAEIYRQREWLNTTLSSIGDAVMATDNEGKLTFVNVVAEKLTGWPKGDAVGQPLETVFRIINEQTRQAADNPTVRALREGTVVGLANHTLLVARDGKEIPIDDSAAPIRDEHGRVSGVVLVFRDVTERRQADHASRRLAAIIESSDDVIVSKDTNGIITSWNPAAERLFGYSAAEAVGKPIAIIAPPDRLQEMPAILARIKKGEKVDHFDTVRRAKDGRLIPISLTVSPIKDEEGHIIGASKIARDISERKRAEEAVREEKERLHATLTGIGDAVIVTDAQCRVTLINPVAQELTGWRDEATARPLDEVFRIINEQTRQPAVNPVTRAMREGVIVGLANHTLLIARNGAEIPIDDSAAPIRDSRGQVVGVVLVFRDDRERRRVENESRKNQDILQLVYTVGKIGYWEWNSATDQVIWSPENEALYGLEPGTFGGKYDAWEKLLHPDDLPRAKADVRKAFDTGRYYTEFRVIWPDGSIHWIEARANVFKDEHGKPVLVRGVNMDVTERRRHEEALREADQRKNEFLATLAHELRNPLAPIHSALQVLRVAGPLGPQLQRVRDILDRQVTHMVRLVDDLMDVSRITRGAIELRKEHLDITSAVQSALETSRPLIDAGQHALKVELPSEPLHVVGDPTRLAQVIANLLNNSAKYTPDSGHIALVVQKERDRAGDSVAIRVRDDGIGIPADMLPKVFDMFTQVERTVDRTRGGLGIGLTLVKQLVELHGGSVEARSGGPGKGSEFIVRLPLSEQPASEPPAPAGPDGHAAKVRRRILLVDDNQDAAESLAMLLRLSDNEVELAFEGPTALEKARTYRPEVVLLDIGMPGMSGYEVARQMRRMPELQGVLLVAQTGWGQEEDRRKSMEAGFNFHLVKPVDPVEVQRLLASLGQSGERASEVNADNVATE